MRTKKLLQVCVLAVGVCMIATNVNAQATKPASDTSLNIPAPPKFSSEDANKGVADFILIMKQYMPALQKGDSTHVKEFESKIQNWSVGATSWAPKLSSDEQAKMGEYFKTVGEELKKKYAHSTGATKK